VADWAGATSYRGTRVLDAPLGHPSRQLRLLALDGWEELFVLRGLEAPATTMPFPGHGWTVETDQGTTHHSVGAGVGGGETIWQWEIDFDSPLPDDATSITVSPGLIDGHPAPATTLNTPPVPIARPVATPYATDDRRTPGCRFCNPLPRADAPAASGPRCPACWAAQHGLDRAVREPDVARPRVIPISADLGNLAGADIALCSLNAWPTWFALTLGAQGDALANHWGPHLGGRWDIEDDHGNHYTGIATSGFSGTSYLACAACAPALDPRAQALTITFADPFGDAGIINTTIPLTA
jgi:hypothetical protein